MLSNLLRQLRFDQERLHVTSGAVNKLRRNFRHPSSSHDWAKPERTIEDPKPPAYGLPRHDSEFTGDGKAPQVSHSCRDSMLPKPPFSNLAGDEGCAVANADNSCRLDRVADSLIAISMRS